MGKGSVPQGPSPPHLRHQAPKSEVARTPSSGLNHLLERFTVRRAVYSLGYGFIIKDVSQEQPDGRGAGGKAWGRLRCFMPSPGALPSQPPKEVLSTLKPKAL